MVYAEDKIRLERLRKRNNLSESEAKKRIDSQASQDEKLKMADYIIYNNKDIEDLFSQTKNVLERIR